MAKKKRKKKVVAIDGDVSMLHVFCRSFLEVVRAEDDYVDGLIRNEGLEAACAYMVAEIKENYVKPGGNTFLISEVEMFKVVEKIHLRYLESVLGRLADKGYLTETIREDGEIVYRRTDKQLPPRGGLLS